MGGQAPATAGQTKEARRSGPLSHREEGATRLSRSSACWSRNASSHFGGFLRRPGLFPLQHAHQIVLHVFHLGIDLGGAAKLSERLLDFALGVPDQAQTVV